MLEILNNVGGGGVVGDIWMQKTSGATARRLHNAVTINNKMYIYGGTNGTSYLNDLWVYTSDINIWEQRASGPSARIGHTAVAINGKMYVFGGYNGSPL